MGKIKIRFVALVHLFLNELHKEHKSFFHIDDLEHYLPKNITPFIIDNLFLAGKIKPGEKKNELVLADEK